MQDSLRYSFEYTRSDLIFGIVTVVLFLLSIILIVVYFLKGNKKINHDKLRKIINVKFHTNSFLKYNNPIKSSYNSSSNNHQYNLTGTNEKVEIKQKTIIRVSDNTSYSESITQNPHKPKVIIPINPVTTFIEVKPEEQKTIKFIGYTPNTLFETIYSKFYPQVIMPLSKSVIKFPRKGRSTAKGFTEDYFHKFLLTHFKSQFQIFNDRFVLVKSNQNPYEPDFTLIDEKDGLNLFLDIEIDEPYDGYKRNAIHYIGFDDNRNEFFKHRGWLTIRFAEIQIFKKPENCCRYIYEVIQSVNPKVKIPSGLEGCNSVEKIPQWTKEQAEIWEKEKYRESYLGIDSFGIQNRNEIFGRLNETEIGLQIEQKVTPATQKNLKISIINQAIETNQYISCKYSEDKFHTIVKPIRIVKNILRGFCYVKNKERSFNINKLNELIIRDVPFQIRVNGEAGIDRIKEVMNDAITNHKVVRMKYTRRGWTNYRVDRESGELIIDDKIEAEESIRTICNIDMALDVLDDKQISKYRLDENHITAYCHKREEERTFRFDRINELEILNI